MSGGIIVFGVSFLMVRLGNAGHLGSLCEIFDIARRLHLENGGFDWFVRMFCSEGDNSGMIRCATSQGGELVGIQKRPAQPQGNSG